MVVMGSRCLTHPTFSKMNRGSIMWNKKIYHTAYFKKMLLIGIAVLVGIVLALIILRMGKTTVKDSHGGAESLHEGAEQVKGPHGGRLLSKDDFQVEITIYERGVPPQFRVYVFDRGKAVDPDEVKLTIELHRLGGRGDVINFRREGEYLCGEKGVG